NFSLDTWTAGGTVFWRDPSVGMLGVDVAYQSMDIGISGDGFRVGARGEWYPSDRWTVSGAIGWETVDFNIVDFDGWYANAAVKYYFSDRFSASLNANYFNVQNEFTSAEPNQWSVGLEGEYLASRETPLSIYAGVRYGEFDL